MKGKVWTGEEDEGFSAWIENVSRGSKVNAEGSSKDRAHLRAIPDHPGRPGQDAQGRGRGDFLFRMVSRLEKEGNSSSSIVGYMKTLKGWWLRERGLRMR